MPRYKKWDGKPGSPKLQYPQPDPIDNAEYELEAQSPRVGRFYRVVDKLNNQYAYVNGIAVGYRFKRKKPSSMMVEVER